MPPATQSLFTQGKLGIHRAQPSNSFSNKASNHEITLTLLLGLKLRTSSRQFDDQSTYRIQAEDLIF